jgi:hypothetical protein
MTTSIFFTSPGIIKPKPALYAIAQVCMTKLADTPARKQCCTPPKTKLLAYANAWSLRARKMLCEKFPAYFDNLGIALLSSATSRSNSETG